MKQGRKPAAPGVRAVATNLNLGTVADLDSRSRPRLLIDRPTGRLFRANAKRPRPREIGVRESVAEMARIHRAADRIGTGVLADDGMIRWLDRLAESMQNERPSGRPSTPSAYRKAQAVIKDGRVPRRLLMGPRGSARPGQSGGGRPGSHARRGVRALR